MFSYPPPAYVACSECGACVPRDEIDEHVCDKERWIDYQLVRLRPDIARFEQDFTNWMFSSHGRFERYYAELTRLREVSGGARVPHLHG